MSMFDLNATQQLGNKWFKPPIGESLFVITGEPLDGGVKETVKNGKTITQQLIQIPIEYNGEKLIWEIAKSGSTKSKFFKLAKLEEQAKGDLIGKTIKLIKSGTGKLTDTEYFMMLA